MIDKGTKDQVSRFFPYSTFIIIMMSDFDIVAKGTFAAEASPSCLLPTPHDD